MTNETVDVQHLLTVQEVVAYTGYTEGHIRLLCINGEIKNAIKRGHQ